jgi:hypothetical protein
LRRVKRRKGRRNLTNFENLPRHDACLRIERGGTCLSLLRSGAQGDRL